MTTRLINLLKAYARRPLIVQTILFRLAVLGVLALAFWAIHVLLTPPPEPTREEIIESKELFVLALLACVGLLMLSWRFLYLQRREVERRITAERQARDIALEDALTGLPNRRRFDDEFRRAVAALPKGDATHALIMLDLNGFKHINDVYGHNVGDEVLVSAATRLRAAVRSGDLVARLGGDEFAVLARDLSGVDEVTGIARRVVKQFEQPISTASTLHYVALGVGIVLIPRDGTDAIELMRRADIALYRAKSERRSVWRFFDAAMDAGTQERFVIERDMRDAIDSGAIQPRFQPLVDLETGRVAGFEALPYWKHPTLGVIAPDRIVSIAESSGLRGDLSDRLMRLAASAARQWPPDVMLSVKTSDAHLSDLALGERVLSVLSEEGLSPRRLEIALTEATLARSLDVAPAALTPLSDAGVRIVVDDFGAAYIRLYGSHNIKFDRIKIARAFTDRIERDPEAWALVRALLGFGRAVSLTVSAEGVKGAEQAKMLQESGCELAQGYLFGEPMTAAETQEFLAARQTSVR